MAAERGRVDAGTIYAVLRSEVQSGELVAGQPVREVAVAERFGVSRTPVREALRWLRHDRLLVPTERGLAVREVSADEVIAVYNLRILLEGEAAAGAAESCRQADLLSLESLLERDRELHDPSDRERAETNVEFHEALWEAAHNPVLHDLLRRLTGHVVRVPHSTLSEPGRWQQALDEHAALVDSIRAGDAARARRVAEEHMTSAREVRLQLLRRYAGRTPARGV